MFDQQAVDKAKEFISSYDPEFKIEDQYYAIHSMNPFSPECSSNRLYMYSLHLSQSLPIYNGENKIVQTGLEKQFAGNSFSIATEDDVKIIAIIDRYKGISATSANKVVTKSYIVYNFNKDEYDIITLPYYNSTHPTFGYKYKWNDKIIKELRTGSVIPKSTMLATTPTIEEGDTWKMGVNANLALISLPETAEDGAIISEELAQKMSYDVFETRSIEFGSNSFLLNVYGDENNYKPFPDIGELVNEDSVLAAIREYDDDFDLSLTSKRDTMKYNNLFDKVVYVKGPGRYINTPDGLISTSEVVDIKAYKNEQRNKDVYTGTTMNVNKYIDGLNAYYQDIKDVYENIQHEHRRRYKNDNVKLSNRFHKLIVEAYSMLSNNTKFTYRNELTDIYRITFTIRHRVIPGVGSKITDSFGSKCVVVSLKKSKDMPYTIDEFGNKIYADIVTGGIEVISRMNPGRLYEHFFNDMSRRCKNLMLGVTGGIKDTTQLPDNIIEHAYDIYLGLLEIIGTEQFTMCKEVTDIVIKREIVDECLNKEVYLLYRVSSPKQPWQVVNDAQDTIYYPKKYTAYMDRDGKTITFDTPMRIAPIYEMLLNKTADNFLAVSSAKINHYGVLINSGSINKTYAPWAENPVRNVGETEGRLFNAYGSEKLIAELKDRSASIKTHKTIYNNILEADQPTNIDQVIDRNRCPYGDDSALDLVTNIFNATGIDITYTAINKR